MPILSLGLSTLYISISGEPDDARLRTATVDAELGSTIFAQFRRGGGLLQPRKAPYARFENMGPPARRRPAPGTSGHTGGWGDRVPHAAEPCVHGTGRPAASGISRGFERLDLIVPRRARRQPAKDTGELDGRCRWTDAREPNVYSCKLRAHRDIRYFSELSQD
jgi:hypothetical protein